jgi:kinesin family protein 3/17
VIVEHSTVNVETAAKSVTIGKLNLVDLAGSERVKDSDVQGQQLEEAMKINLSLSAFGKVILALTSPGQQHIPYRDSKLTRILQDSLGGNCKTTLITTITPVSLHYSETINSLKFANRAKSVKNYAMVNEDFSQQAMLSKYEQEIKKLRRALAQQQIGTGSDHLVVREELHRVQSQWAQVTKEKEDVESELAKRLEEVEQTQHEKKKLQQRIEELEKEVLVGGKRPEETPEFEMAVRKAQEQLQNEYESKYRDLEREKEALAKEKEELHAKQQELLTRDRELQSAACNRSSDSPTSDPARSNSPFPEAVSPTGDNSQYWV